MVWARLMSSGDRHKANGGKDWTRALHRLISGSSSSLRGRTNCRRGISPSYLWPLDVVHKRSVDLKLAGPFKDATWILCDLAMTGYRLGLQRCTQTESSPIRPTTASHPGRTGAIKRAFRARGSDRAGNSWSTHLDDPLPALTSHRPPSADHENDTASALANDGSGCNRRHPEFGCCSALRVTKPCPLKE